MQLRHAAMWVLVVLSSAGAIACKEASAQELVRDEATLAEKHPEGTLHWKVAEDGKAQLVLQNPAGELVRTGVTGQLQFQGSAGTSPASVNLVMNEKTGILEADGPDLDAELTELKYTLLVDGKPRTGFLHLPARGTAGLAEVAPGATGEPATGEPAKGEHDGVVQVVGGKKYEMVADSASGLTRVYLVGDHGPRPKKLQLAVDADPPARVNLVWQDEGYYLSEVELRQTPRKVSLVVVDHDSRVHVALIGFRPGVVLAVDARPVFWVRRGWARGHHKGTLHGPPGHAKVHVKDEQGPGQIKVQVKHKGGGGKTKVDVKVR
jgi:hypothetical protein